MTHRVGPRLRDLTSADAVRILDITRATGVFREEELAIADEVFHDAVAPAGPSGGPPAGAWGGSHATRPYYALGAEVDGELMGWICWGKTPCTEGTWDLYWLAVDPAAYRRGVARALVAEMEGRLAGMARLIAVDTSGRPDYGPTRDFYEAVGYAAVARVPGFYAPGDDQVIFTKAL
ncbi:MAG: GNAT family N-acetyltransferase [Gemmatimonadetes bacterium]|nr:GNAT family N-acetyltransferase [Gemmatimonadota bacterium]MBP6669391.1 GNAT family N-acetyltransferase [Gemmatimonadales bacterium]MBK7351394.1 GNAT family N-acetyltransferase [Gemmatimonadota bacterium]MBK7786557.1 GNAT family N-acetyltransferase [Gemmatimonadota bacterium]MBK7922913.1 GNAT family N-acetyltransferase [Gemmatimonadota bacterium]